jgi:hypothetical protein
MLKYGLSAALLVAALPAFAQNPAPSGAIGQTAQAFAQCVQAGIAGVPASVTPEAGATTVLGGCATQFQALRQAAEAMIATMPADQQAAARDQMRTQIAAAQTQVAGLISRRRAGAAATPAAAQ